MSEPNGHLVSGRIESPMQALVGLGPDMVLSGIYDGTWALVDMVFALLDRIGPSDVTISSWTFANANVNESVALAGTGVIKSLRFLCDLNFCDAHPKLVTALRARYGQDCVVEWMAHSKFICFRGGEFDVLYLSSANLHKDRRLETFTVVSGGSTARDYLELIDDLLANPPTRRRFTRDGLAQEIPIPGPQLFEANR